MLSCPAGMALLLFYDVGILPNHARCCHCYLIVQVLAALVPLLERRTLNIAARAESVAAAPGFQLIATVTSAPGVGD